MGCLTFTTTFFVGGRNLLSVWLAEQSKALQGVISNRGRTLTIEIPPELQQPAPNAFSALLQIAGSWDLKRRVRGRTFSFVTTTGCPASRRWAILSTLFYVRNSQSTPPSSRSAEGRTPCRR